MVLDCMVLDRYQKMNFSGAVATQQREKVIWIVTHAHYSTLCTHASNFTGLVAQGDWIMSFRLTLKLGPRTFQA